MESFAGAVAVGAIALSWGIGGVLTFAVGMAATEPLHAPVRALGARVARGGRRVWALGVSGLLGGLWAVCWRVLWLASLLGDLAVTYVHTYRADRGTGRHYPGMGRRFQSAGRHRAPAWA